jgi:1,4-dihydroxy-6-naphthoate synthase
LPGHETTFERGHISALNRAAEQEVHDLTSISSAFYPRLAAHYRILAVGTSVGRGYGPVLVSRDYHALSDLAGKRIGVGGRITTGATLAAMYCPEAELVEMRYDQIADAVARGELEAGVMIHEELLFFPSKGLHQVANLGSCWCAETGLPLPVGLSVVHRRLGEDLSIEIARVSRDSLQWALNHYAEAFAFASQFGRGCSAQHVEMFSNADTLCMPADVRQAMRLMFDRVAAMGLGPSVDQMEIVDA